MCLAVAGKIISIKEDKAQIDFLGITKEASIALIDFDLKINDYVLVHAGFVIQKITDKEAQNNLDGVKEML